jgi:hypothetical protein
MRKALGLLLATSLLLPIGAIAFSPAGAATATTNCKALSGKQTYSPTLPKLTGAKNPPTVKSTVTTSSKLTGCVGGGVTSATATSKTTYVGNCNTFVAGYGKPTKGTSTIKWNTGATSTVATTLTAITKPGVSPALAKLVSKFTKGLFVGHTSTVTIKATAVGGAKACVSQGLSGFSFVNSGPFKNT